MPSTEHWEVIQGIALWSGAVGVLAAAVAIHLKLIPFLLGRARGWRDRRILIGRLGNSFTPEEVRRATTDYVPLECDLAGQPGVPEGPTAPKRLSLFRATDEAFREPRPGRLVVFLGESGMGKTSFLLNYAARHWKSKKRRKHYNLQLLSLNLPGADAALRQIENTDRPMTVLLLDAFDEDRAALADPIGRLSQILSLTDGFRNVAISSSIRFFPADPEIRSAALWGGPRDADAGTKYVIERLHLRPFGRVQFDGYLEKRFPFYRRIKRREARRTIESLPELMGRPLLLTHVDDLAHERRSLRFTYHAYEAILQAWLEREKSVADDPEALRAFAERAAVDAFVNGEIRGMESVPAPDLESLGTAHRVRFHEWTPRADSILVRDPAGNMKFAHRSIMEYLFTKRFADGEVPASPARWTEQIRLFFDEMWTDGSVSVSGSVSAIEQHRVPKDKLNDANLNQADLHAMDLSGANLADADLGRSNLAQANLSHASLTDANLGRARLNGADLSRASLCGADLSGADLSGARITEADLRGANLTGAILTDADLSQAKLTGAILHRATLGQAHLEGTSLSRANLSGAVLNGSHLEAADLSLANLRGASLRQTELTGADLGQADLSDANLAEANFTRANLRRANLRYAKLFGANLNRANLRSAKLSGASLARANLEGAKLGGANLWEADLNDANLDRADFRDATVSGEQIKTARTRDGARFDPELTEQLDPSNQKLQPGWRRY